MDESISHRHGFNAEKFEGYLKSIQEKLYELPAFIKISANDGRAVTVPRFLHLSKQTYEELSNKPLPKDSFLLVAYPKAGTHWIAEVMKMLIEQDTTYDDVPKESLFLDILPPSAIQDIHNGNTRLVYNTHFPLWFLPPQGIKNIKKVFVYRNPKDTLVSLYHNLLQGEDDWKPTFEELFEIFLGPTERNPIGSWFDYLSDYWDNYRHMPDILCVSFEETKKNPLQVVKMIDAHLGTHSSNDFIEKVIKATSFGAMKEGKAASEKYMQNVIQGTQYRKGEVGDWKNWLSEAQSLRFDERIRAWQAERKQPVPVIFEL